MPEFIKEQVFMTDYLISDDISYAINTKAACRLVEKSVRRQLIFNLIVFISLFYMHIFCRFRSVKVSHLQ